MKSIPFLIATVLVVQPCLGDVDDARSYVEIIRDNGMSLQSYDLLARTDMTYMLPNGKYEDVKIMHRIAIDAENERLLCVRRMDITRSSQSNPSVLVRSQALMGVAGKSGNAYGWHSAFGKRVYSQPLKTLVNTFEVPDPRAAGITSWLGQRAFLKRYLNPCFPNAFAGVISEQDRRINVQLDCQMHSYPIADMFTNYTWNIDAESYMPSNLTVTNHVAKYNTIHTSHKFRWDWVSRNNTWVPALQFIERDYQERPKNKEDKPVMTKQMVDTQFFWISVNRELPDNLFLHENIKDQVKMLDLVSAEKVGAAELVDGSVSETTE